MLTITFTTGEGVNIFVAVEGQEGNPFLLMEENASIPEKPEIFGLGGQRKDWIAPVEGFVASLEERGLKLRYGGTFVGDFNQVLRRGGIFGYPALKHVPRGKLRVLYEAAPMAYIAEHARGYASDGVRPILSIEPSSLSETTPLYVGSAALVREVETLVSRP